MVSSFSQHPARLQLMIRMSAMQKMQAAAGGKPLGPNGQPSPAQIEAMRVSSHLINGDKADWVESDATRDDEETQGSRTGRCSEDDAGHDGWWRCTRRRTWWDGYRKYDEVHDGRWRWRWGYAQYGSDAG